jgi:hypothetical protein
VLVMMFGDNRAPSLTVIAATRRGITYTPRLDEQMVAMHARPAP